MLKQLRIKFIALNMGSAALVLMLAFGAICYLDYQGERERLYNALGATLEQPNIPENHTPPSIGGPELPPEDFFPVALYRIDKSGHISSERAHVEAEISSDVLDEAIMQALSARAHKGHLEDLSLFYERHETPNGILIAFADEATIGSWKTLAATLSLVGIFVLAILFVINLFFSRWALSPVDTAWRKQRQFVADASHELKTPLTVIMANNAILQSNPESSISNQSQWIESTQRESERMQTLVNDMLELAQLNDMQRTQAELTDVDVSDLVEKTALQFESVAYEHGVELVTDITPDLHIQGELPRLQRMASTLIDNACKYSKIGEAISVCVRRDGKNALISVNNSGNVIDPEDLPHVFDRFYRADKSRTSSGHGLGLAIAQEIAHTHGGMIVVSSTEEAGTTFTVTLPL